MITIGCKSLGTLCKDYEFVVNDKNQLAELIAMLVMGWSRHGSSPSYSATKRYCNTYLEALSQLVHIRGLDITFTDIRPGFVDTDLLSKDFHYPMMMKPQPVAHSIVRGILSGKRIVTIDWRFRILVFFWRLIPSCLWERMKIG